MARADFRQMLVSKIDHENTIHHEIVKKKNY